MAGAEESRKLSVSTSRVNGLVGVTLYSHAPGENVNSKTITRNLIETNHLDPDHDFGPPFDGQTTGVIAIAASNVAITIKHNIIFNNMVGMRLSPSFRRPQSPLSAPPRTGSSHVTKIVVTVS